MNAIWKDAQQITANDVMRQIVNRIVKYPLENIRSMKLAGRETGEERFSNLGYPIGLLVSACIEVVGSLVYEKNCSTDQYAYYMRNYMGQVDELYSIKFEKKYSDNGKNTRDSYLSDIMYGYFRSKLAHSANAIAPLPVDAKEQTTSKHMMMQSNGSILIHGYALYVDFLKSLQVLHRELENDGSLLSRVADNISILDEDTRKTTAELLDVFSSRVWIKGQKTPLNTYPKRFCRLP